MLSDSQIDVMIDQQTLEDRIAQMGKQISVDYDGKQLMLVGVLKGACMFMMQLSKSITIPCMMDFMVVSSYGNGTVSSGNISIHKDIEENAEAKDILICEDIIDTGRTLEALRKHLLSKGASSVKICTMLDKPSRRVVPVEVAYSGFKIRDEFVVGYGLDYGQLYRNLPYIGFVRQPE